MVQKIAERGGVAHERVLGEQRRADRSRLFLGGEAEAVDGCRFGDPDAAHAGPAAGRERGTMGADDRFDVVQQLPGQTGGVPGRRGPDGRRGGAVLQPDDDVLVGAAVPVDDQTGRQRGHRAGGRVEGVAGRCLGGAQRGQHPAQQQAAADPGEQEGASGYDVPAGGPARRDDAGAL